MDSLTTLVSAAEPLSRRGGFSGLGRWSAPACRRRHPQPMAAFACSQGQRLRLGQYLWM